MHDVVRHCEPPSRQCTHRRRHQPLITRTSSTEPKLHALVQRCSTRIYLAATRSEYNGCSRQPARTRAGASCGTLTTTRADVRDLKVNALRLGCWDDSGSLWLARTVRARQRVPATLHWAFPPLATTTALNGGNSCHQLPAKSYSSALRILTSVASARLMACCQTSTKALAASRSA